MNSLPVSDDLSSDMILGVAPAKEQVGAALHDQWPKEVLPILQEVLKRGQYRCVSCGIQSQPSQQFPLGKMTVFHRKNGYLMMPEPANVQQAQVFCPFCASAFAINWSVCPTNNQKTTAQSFSFEGIGVSSIPQKRSPSKHQDSPGLLIFCPSMKQNTLNRLAHYLCGYQSVHQEDSLPQTMLDSKNSESQQQEVSRKLSLMRDIDVAFTALSEEVALKTPFYPVTAEKSSADFSFARALSLLPEEIYEKRYNLISSLRWWPRISFWKSTGHYLYHASKMDEPSS